MFEELDEYRIQYRKCLEKSEKIEKSRIFTDPDHYLVMGVHNMKLLEMEHSSTEFFVYRINSLRKYKTNEINVI